MQEEETRVAAPVQEEPRFREDHPWLSVSEDDGPDEVIRYSLDEIRFL